MNNHLTLNEQNLVAQAGFKPGTVSCQAYIAPSAPQFQIKVSGFFNIASGSEANMTTPCEMEIFNFLWLIWDHYLPLAPT